MLRCLKKFPKKIAKAPPGARKTFGKPIIAVDYKRFFHMKQGIINSTEIVIIRLSGY